MSSSPVPASNNPLPLGEGKGEGAAAKSSSNAFTPTLSRKEREKMGRSRMIWWLVVLPATLLLLALGAAKWKVFHLAYCKHLIRSGDPWKAMRGTELIVRVHVQKGMTVEQVRKTVSPHELKVWQSDGLIEPSGQFGVSLRYRLEFDKEGRLLSCVESPPIPDPPP